MKNEKGITLLSLIITAVIMAIIGFTTYYTATGVDKNLKGDVLEAELQKVHHIVLQEWNKKLTLGDYELKGTPVENTSESDDELDKEEDKLNQGIETSKQIFIRKVNENGEDRYYGYYKLTPENLNRIGAKNAKSEYIVCYETGEVANITEYKTSTGEILYTK